MQFFFMEKSSIFYNIQLIFYENQNNKHLFERGYGSFFHEKNICS